jgi:hypothetical protein
MIGHVVADLAANIVRVADIAGTGEPRIAAAARRAQAQRAAGAGRGACGCRPAIETRSSTTSRGRDGPNDLLRDWRGKLQVDRHTSWEHLFVGGDVVEAG